MRYILVTSALPYANGPIHLGHLVEHIQTDIWVRTMRMSSNNTVYYVCADDAHGTPIMLSAEKEGILPQQLIKRMWTEHKQDFDFFGISFDNYHSTHSEENRQLSETIYIKLRESGLIKIFDIDQAYDPVRQIFLPDRLIKGQCQKCGAKDQYGDLCEKCGSIYNSNDLIKPYSVLSGVSPIYKKSTHYFFKLSDPRCVNFLRQWVTKLTQTEAINKIREWLGIDSTNINNNKLNDWNISRDAPYFGFNIPDVPNKFFYVWLDAPVGYYASFLNLCKKKGLDFKEWVNLNSKTEIYHFIGKDILYFHMLFWPAILNFSGYKTPTNIFVHGFLTINGQKMSKSRGTFISARSYINANLDPDLLRYYFASKLSSSIEDLDFNSIDFINKINSDIIGKYVNIASRILVFLNKYFNNRINDSFMSAPILEHLRSEIPLIADYYEQREYNSALRKIMELVNKINTFINIEKPWEIARRNNISNTHLHKICSISLEAFRLVTIALKPVIPSITQKVENLLNISPLSWKDTNIPLSSTNQINLYKHLTSRVNINQVRKLFPDIKNNTIN